MPQGGGRAYEIIDSDGRAAKQSEKRGREEGMGSKKFLFH